MSQPLLSGEYIESPPEDLRDTEITQLRNLNRRLDEALRLERNKTGQIESALRELRRITLPFHKLLQAVHGEIDNLGIHEAITTSTTDGVWEKWKQKFGGKKAEVIEALQSHPMTRDQIRVATRSGWSTVDESVKHLKDVGLIEKVNGKYQLKAL